MENWHSFFEELHHARHSEDGSHDIGHIRRVWKVAKEIAESSDEAVDLLVLLAACYLHDWIEVPKNSPLRSKASKISADAAAAILRSEDFPAEKIPAVSHAIEAHSFSANVPCETIEAKILQDVDRMEAIGAIGIARCFYTGGLMNTKLWHPTEPFSTTRTLDDAAFSVDHFYVKLLKLEDSLQTEGGKKIAQQRSNFMKMYLEQLRDEIC